MKIVAVVLSWNSRAYISDCLTSLKKIEHTGHELEIVVVDNASTDGSPDFLASHFPKVTLIPSTQNLGYAAGNNLGIKHAQEKSAAYVWIVNPDVEVAPDALAAFLAAAQKYPRAGIFTPKIYFSKGYEFHKDRYTKSELGKVIWSAGGLIDWANLLTSHRGVNEVDIGQYNTDQFTQYATGASIFINSQVIKQVGLIDPRYYLYYEENDLCQRALRAGFQIVYVAAAVCWHANAQATGIGSPLQDYYTTRNRLLFGLYWAPWRTKFALFRESLKLLLTGRPWQKRGVLDFYLLRFGPGSYA